MKLIVSIACGPSALPFIHMCIESLAMQSRRPDAVFLASDCGFVAYRAKKLCEERGLAFIDSSEGRPHPPLFVLANTIRNLTEVGFVTRSPIEIFSHKEDIVAFIDGDDWLCRKDALEIVYKAHAKGAWVTYGSWVSNAKSHSYPHRLPAYPKGVEVRKHPWLATQLRTFRLGLYAHIDHAHLTDPATKNYFRCCPDLALMFPAIEMAGWDRVQHIPEPIYFYNRDSGASVADTRRAEQVATESIIKGLPAYKRLEAL
jgi:hypothetical protein